MTKLLEAGTLKPITGTMSIRQVTTIYKPKNVTNYRTLSCCRCGLNSICPHYKVLTPNGHQKMCIKKEGIVPCKMIIQVRGVKNQR